MSVNRLMYEAEESQLAANDLQNDLSPAAEAPFLKPGLIPRLMNLLKGSALKLVPPLKKAL